MQYKPTLFFSMALLIHALCACAAGPSPELKGEPQVHPTPAAGPVFPQDRLQPWEEIERGASTISQDSELLPGREWYLSSPAGVEENGEAARISAAPEASAFAIYRMPLDDQPGTLAVDVNLLDDGSGAPSSYYLGIADYSSGHWHWQGPYSESHVRIPTAVHVHAGADYISNLGNMFVAMLLVDGTVDMVAVGTQVLDVADLDAPLAPAGLSGTGVQGGLELDWNDNEDADLAGYFVHYSSQSFINPDSAGVRTWPAMQGSPGMLLPADSSIFVRITAIDHSGNRSQVSELIEVEPLTGTFGQILLTVDQPSAGIGMPVQLAASGSDLYDWDSDGDGGYETTGDSTGLSQAYTDMLGIIRPRVRGYDSSETAVALGAVSLLISGNSRPVAEGLATPAGGVAPLIVNFSGTASTDFDGNIVGGGWDFDGDGTYDIWDDTDIVHVSAAQFNYTVPGTYNAKLRVVDDKGAWDVDTLTINVSAPDPGPENKPPLATLTADPPAGEKGLTATFSALGSVDPDGGIVDYEWDIDGNGVFNETGAEADNKGNPVISIFYGDPSLDVVMVRVTDDEAATALASASVRVRGWLAVDVTPPIGEAFNHPSLAVVNGHPVLAFRQTTDGGALFYARSASASGTKAADWQSVLVADTDTPRVGPDIQLVAGHPAIACYDSINEELLYYRSDSVNGLDPLDWQETKVADLDHFGWNLSMAVVNGSPAIVYEDSGVGNVNFAYSSTATGNSALDWSGFQLAANSGYPHMAIVSGEPAVSYRNFGSGSLMYAKSATAGGQSPGNWQHVIVETAAGTGVNSRLAVINGFPAISYYNTQNNLLHYVYATQENAANAIFWQAPIQFNITGDAGEYSTLLEYQHSPRITFFRGISTSVDMMICASQFGDDASHWQHRQIDPNADNLPDSMDSAIVDGMLAVVFVGVGDDIEYRLLID